MKKNCEESIDFNVKFSYQRAKRKMATHLSSENLRYMIITFNMSRVSLGNILNGHTKTHEFDLDSNQLFHIFENPK